MAHEYELLAMSTIARLVKEDGEGAAPIDAAVALLAAAMRERDEAVRERGEASRRVTAYVTVPSGEQMQAAADRVMERIEPCTFCSRPIFSVRAAIAETDLDNTTGSAEAIRELWARVQRLTPG